MARDLARGERSQKCRECAVRADKMDAHAI
jgi:hypothetical protein